MKTRSPLEQSLAIAAGIDGDVSFRRFRSLHADRLATFSLHAHDLLTAATALEHLRAKGDGVEQRGLNGVDEALWSGLVLAYCRCFDGKARKPHHLKVEEVFPGDTKGGECHQWLWDQRDKYIAHDLNDRRYGAVAVVLDAQGEEFYFRAISAIMSDVAASHRTILQLVRHATQHVQLEMDRLTKVVEADLRAMSNAQRLALGPLSIDLGKLRPDQSRLQKGRKS